MLQYASRPTQHRHHAYESPAKREEIAGLPNAVTDGGSTILTRWFYRLLTLRFYSEDFFKPMSFSLVQTLKGSPARKAFGTR